MTTTTDHELMQRLAAGDTDALEVLVCRWQGGVSRVLGRLAPSEADDLSQEVFLRVFNAASRYRPTGSFSAWLYRIVVNLARDSARRRQLRNWLPLGDTDATDPKNTPPTACAHKELGEKVEDALRELPVRMREVLVLKHYGDLTFAEVAVALREPVSTIKSRTHTALKRLQAELGKRGVRQEELEP